MHSHEEATISAFIVSPRRARYRQMLTSAKRRRVFLDRLNHCLDFDERFVTVIKSNTDVALELRRRGAPESCYVISATDDIDGKDIPLDDAIDAAELAGWGTIISCLPGRLAYYYDECGERRMVLERPQP